MTTSLDFSDAPFILRETCARETAACLALADRLAWDADFDGCTGDGWDRPFMVRSEGHLAIGAARGFAASGTISDGRPDLRDARFDVIASATAQAISPQ